MIEYKESNRILIFTNRSKNVERRIKAFGGHETLGESPPIRHGE